MKNDFNNDIVIYENKSGQIECRVNLKEKTIWLSLDQISTLFDKNKSTISRHIKNICDSGELNRSSVVANFATTATDGKTYSVDYYNLDMIISIGYRVNSKIATQFRKWATNVLRRYIVDGYAINEEKLKQEQKKVKTLQDTIQLLSRTLENQVKTLDEGQIISKILSDYARGLDLLDQFDHKTLDTRGKSCKEAVRISEQEFLGVIDKMKSEFASDVFANPKDGSFSSSVNQIYQIFAGEELYPSLEEKAS